MARQNVFLPSVNAGEFSPKLEARIDYAKYPNGAKRLKNALLLPQGGFYRRPGTRYVANTKSDGEAHLFPFVFNDSDAFIVEAGAAYFRFIRYQSQLTVANTDAAVTNGTFASNITGWDDISSGSGAIAHDSANGRLQLTGSAGDSAIAEQDITTSNTSTAHTIRFRVQGTLGLVCKFQVGSSSGAASYAFEDGSTQMSLGVGWHTITFTPTASPFYVQFINDNTLTGAAENVFIDDVSLIDNNPLELTHPYTAAETHELHFEQSGDVIYFLHEDYWPYKLQRWGTNSWSMTQVFFEDGPWNEVNEGTDLTKGQLVTNPQFETGVSDWTLTSAVNAINSYDGEQGILSMKMLAASSNAATATYAMSTGFRSGTSTQYVCHFLIVGDSGNNIFTALNIGSSSGGGEIASTTDYVSGWHTVDFATTAATVYFQFDFNGTTNSNGGLGALYCYPADSRLIEPSATTGSATLTAYGFSPFTSNDVGRYMRFEYPGREPGWGIITAVASGTSATLQVRRRLPFSGSEGSTESWRFGAWSTGTGFPRRMTFFEGRSIFGNQGDSPRALWFSQTLNLENFRPDSFVEGGTTIEDDDALTFTLSSPTADDIQWLTSQQRLVIGALGGPWVASSQGAVLTPSDRSFVPQTAVKTSNIQPLVIGNSVLFLSLSQKRIYELTFQFDVDQFVARDLTQLADHVASEQFSHLAYQQDPYPLVWCGRDTHDVVDGQLYCLAYNRVEDVVGWSRIEMGGTYSSGRLGLPAIESITTIPGANDSGQTFSSADRDEVWTVVTRTVNSATVRTIEMFEGIFDGPLREEYSTESAWVTAMQTAQANAFYLDAAITVDNSGSPSTSVSGLTHLEGETVYSLSDGVIQGPFTVSSGAITLSTAADVSHVGLRYTTEFESLKMPYGTRQGTGMVKPKRPTSIPIAFHDTGSVDIGLITYDETSGRIEHTNETVTRTKSATTTLDTFEIRVPVEGTWTNDPRVWITITDPLPMTVLGYGADIESTDAPITS